MFKLLLVEDNESILEGLLSYFKSEGVEVVGFTNGLHAVEHLKAHDIDVILSDVSMPAVTGPQMFELIKESHREPPLLIYLTGQPRLDVNNTYLKGARAVLSKPIAPKDLLNTLLYFHKARESEKAYQRSIAKQSIEALDSMKMASFGSMASAYIHELNNALNLLMGQTDLNLKKAEKLPPAEKAIAIEYLAPVKQQTTRIYQTITGLRTLFLNTEQISLNAVDVRDICLDAIKFSEHKVSESEVLVSSKLPDQQVMAQCHRALMTQVIINLVSNACDAIKGIATREIKITLEDQKQSWILKVSDSGPGIPPEIRSELTKVGFTTKDGRKSASSGLGIGLSICKKIVDAHKGRFYLDTDATHTCFVIECPKDPSLKLP